MNLQEARIFDCFAQYDVRNRVEISSPLSAEWKQKVAMLDAERADDCAYRDILSTASKKPLRRKETWRARVMSCIADLQLSGN